jgi:hypothetical protein
MDNLPDWVIKFAAVTVGLSPGLAVLSARSIARLIHRVTWLDKEQAVRRGREPGREEPVRAPG